MTRRNKGAARRMLRAAIAAGLEREEGNGSALPEVRLWVGGSRHQVLGESLVLELRSSGLRCDVVVTGEILVPRRVREARTIHLKPLALELAPMRKTVVQIQLPTVALAPARRALRRGQPVMVLLDVDATDSRGHAAQVERRIMLGLGPTTSEDEAASP